MTEQRYTLTLPAELFEELREQAEQRGMTIKELVRQFMKLGLLALRFENDADAGLFLKEKLPNDAGVRETRLMMM